MVSINKPSIIKGPDVFGAYYLPMDNGRGMSAHSWETLLPWTRKLYPLLTKSVTVSGQENGTGSGLACFNKTNAYE